MAWLDLKLIKQSVSMEQLLDRYGISLKKQNQTQLRGLCPLPSHSSKDSKWSFNVNVEKSIWSCKSESCVNASGRKGGNTLDFVAAMEKCSIVDAAKKIVEWYPQNGVEKKETPPTHVESAATSSTSNPTPVAEINKPLAWELKGIAYHPYLERRGISKETAEKFGVGFFPGKGSMAGRVVIPIRNENGELVGYAGRAIDDSEPKYRLPAGFHKSLVLYNRFAVSGDVCVIVEGFVDCWKVSEAGFPCVALMGCSLSEVQEKLLTFKRLALMLDSDESGQNATKELAVRLAKGHYVRIIEVKGQPDSMTSEEIKAALRFC